MDTSTKVAQQQIKETSEMVMLNTMSDDIKYDKEESSKAPKKIFSECKTTSVVTASLNKNNKDKSMKKAVRKSPSRTLDSEGNADFLDLASLSLHGKLFKGCLDKKYNADQMVSHLKLTRPQEVILLPVFYELSRWEIEDPRRRVAWRHPTDDGAKANWDCATEILASCELMNGLEYNSDPKSYAQLQPISEASLYHFKFIVV